MSKTYLCGITSSGNEKNLREMIEPVLEFFDGLIWTFHGVQDAGWQFLEDNKGDGRIIPARWCERHGYSMTHILWQGPMQEGDKFVVLDSMERISPQFCREKLLGYLQLMDEANIAVIANYGKPFIFRFNEALEFRGTPHWYPINVDGDGFNVDLEKNLFWNVRGEQRDKMQFVEHYVKYYLYPVGANHCQHGLDKNGDVKELFPPREKLRLHFRNELRKRGIPLTVDGVKTLLAGKLDDTLKFFINNEKILNDAYRLWVLKDDKFPDDHDFKNIVKI